MHVNKTINAIHYIHRAGNIGELQNSGQHIWQINYKILVYDSGTCVKHGCRCATKCMCIV